MRHFLDRQNVYEVQAALRLNSPPGYLTAELRDPQRMLKMMRDWYRQIPNPEYFDVFGLTKQFLAAYLYEGGEMVDVPYALQFAEDINSGGHCLADWPLRGKERGAVPYQVAMEQEPEIHRTPRDGRWLGQPDPRYNPRSYSGSPAYVGMGAQTRTVPDRRVARAFEQFGGAPHYVGGIAAPLYRPSVKKGACVNQRASAGQFEDDWIYSVLEPEIFHDIQLTLNRHYDKYSRCSGRQSSQRQVKLELELSDSQPNRMPMRLPNARATTDCANKRVGTEALYYSSDPLSNGSAYCGDQFEYV
jgi:hypothetical protein